MLSRIYQQANELHFVCVASLRYPIKILDLLYCFNCMTLMNISKDSDESQPQFKTECFSCKLTVLLAECGSSSRSTGIFGWRGIYPAKEPIPLGGGEGLKALN